ncbi:MAG: helix-turn-helix transcriptional regulator [Kiritimatiellae bacterium]|nr:helix-turn-helix transcriptional regulator [Kiritimatiellia bacterium]
MTVQDIAKIVQLERKRQGMTQPDLAAACGTGVRFIVDLERGKETCQIGKVLLVLRMLGIKGKLSQCAS